MKETALKRESLTDQPHALEWLVCGREPTFAHMREQTFEDIL